MRLIDADALIDRIKNPYEQAQVARWVNEQPTIEPEKRTEKRAETHACDCISRQAAIDAILHNQEVYSNNFGNDPIDKYTIAIIDNDAQTIAQLPSAQPERKWIPVSERLPEDGTDIFVTYVDEEETRIIPVNYGRGTWFDCIFDRALDSLKVTAWMPLPEPYRAKRRTDDA